MTVFGILWFGTVGFCFCQKNIKYMMFVTLLFMTFQCVNVISIGDFEVGPQILTSLVFIIKVLHYKHGKLKINKRHIPLIVSALLLLTVVVVSCLYNGSTNSALLYIFQLAIYIFCFFSFLQISNVISRDDIYKMIRCIVIILLTIGVIQVLTTMEILPLRSVLKILLYNDTSDNVYFHHSNYSRILSTFMEPSYFAGILVGAFYYFLSFTKKWKKNIILLIVIGIELIFTMSTTAYVAFFIVGIIFFLFQGKISLRKKCFLIVLALIAFIFMYVCFYNVLDKVIFSKTDGGSYNTRYYWNKNAINTFLTSKWFGTGYKSVRGSSIIYTILAELGIIGLCVYLIFNLMIFMPLIISVTQKNKFDIYHLVAIYPVIGVFVCQVIACPDLDLCTYWFWLYVLALSIDFSYKRKKIVKIDREIVRGCLS